MNQIIFEYVKNMRFSNNLKTDVGNLLISFSYDHVRTVYTNGEFFDEIYYGMTAEEFDLIDPKNSI